MNDLRAPSIRGFRSLSTTVRALLLHLLAALPDALTSWAFWATWSNPLWFDRGMASGLINSLGIEVLALFTLPFFSLAMASGGMRLADRLTVMLPVGLTLLLFALGVSATDSSWWLFEGFLWLLAGKVYYVIRSRRALQSAHSINWRVLALWPYTFVVFMAALMLCFSSGDGTHAPRLTFGARGLDPATLTDLGLGSGMWIFQKEPVSAMAFGTLYFAALSLFKLVTAPGR